MAHELDGDGEVHQRVAVVSDPDDMGARAVELCVGAAAEKVWVAAISDTVDVEARQVDRRVRAAAKGV